ncbi:hypothetical protein E2C01_034791 [Portunus trituberculatus]|uniref:Uncharacterized protein n=1 Tax=Portunus trituberculatus TaxID=210409 RepID=A0A5B7F6G6_PORTR|nr:hypothetical protein [Portunus trituberculatus]
MQISFSDVFGFSVVCTLTVITTKGGTAKPDTGITYSGFRATACTDGYYQYAVRALKPFEPLEGCKSSMLILDSPS